MADYSGLRPGARIYNANDERATLTCFAIKAGEQHHLYGVTARHCVPAGQYCFMDDPSDGKRICIGGPATHAATIDAACFLIEDDARVALTRANFLPVGYAADIIDVWDPGKLRGKVAGARTSREEDALKAKAMNVNHFGATSLVAPAASLPGQIMKHTASATTSIQQTTIAPGDSGGPVIDPAKNRWVGFVSSGAAAGRSTTGGIVVLHEALATLGLALATWSNRGHWL